MSETFELSLQGITDTVAIADYEMISPKIARVILSYTGNQTPSKIAASVAKMTGNQAAIVENSFRQVNDHCAIGYIRANCEIRPVSEKEIRANYSSASANILMSNEDDSLWEVKKVGDQTYLAKQNNDDLDDLIMAVANHKLTGTPKLATFASVKPQRNELVAFVNDAGDVSYGFVTAIGKGSVKIQASNTSYPVLAKNDRIIGAYEVEIDAATDTAVRKQLSHKIRAAARSDADIKATMSQYYSELFGYDPEYVSKIIQQIEESSFA